MNPPDDNQLDLLAAEYVLGTMRGARSERFEAQMRADPALERRVRAWEARLAPMTEGFEAVESPDSSWRGIERRLFAVEKNAVAESAAGVSGWWRRLALGFAATAVMFLATTLYLTLSLGAPQCYAVLTDAGSRPMAVVFDRRNMKELVVLPVGSRLAGDGGTARLWIVLGNTAVPVGTLNPDGETHLPLDKPMLTAVMGSSARLLVTRESAGAPTPGLPSGERIAEGAVALLGAAPASPQKI